MQEFCKSGRIFFAFAIMAFGFIQLNAQDFMSGFLPMDTYLPARRIWLYLISTLFIVGGFFLCLNKTYRKAGFWVAILLFILFIYPHLVNLLGDLRNPGLWTSAGEDLALCGGALIIASGMDYKPSRQSDKTRDKFFNTGKIFFAVSLIVFAVQHFMYADFISNLIPFWIPARLFFAYFVGVAFSLALISLVTNIKTRLACILLGFMFLFWMIFLHLPRVAVDTRIEAEKTSLFIAFAFSGIFFLIAALYGNKNGARID